MTGPDLADVLARLDRRVADAAEAWLTDPRDTGVYTRLVAAVAERRAVLDAVRPPLHAVGTDDADDADDADGADYIPVAPDPGHAEGSQDDPDDADDTDEPAVPLRPVGADLLGDPRAVLDRLRRG